jgi:hypothetical protein
VSIFETRVDWGQTLRFAIKSCKSRDSINRHGSSLWHGEFSRDER